MIAVPSTAPGVVLVVRYRHDTESREGGCSGRTIYHDYEVPVVRLTGPAIDCVAEFDRAGEATLRGRYPHYATRGLCEIAEAAQRVWDEGGPAPEVCIVDADGDAQMFGEEEVDLGHLTGAYGCAEAWR